jgi:hypothetical protein
MHKVKLVALSVATLLVFATGIEFASFLLLEAAGSPNGINHFAGSRYTPWPEVYHPLTKRTLRPNSRFGIDGQATSDERGYVEIPDRLDNGEVTIVITGASAVRLPAPKRRHGPKDTFGYQLQMLARQRLDVPVNVVSLALDDYTSFQEMMALYEYLDVHRLPADLVVSISSYAAAMGIMWAQDSPEALYPLYDSNYRWQLQSLIERRLGHGVMTDLVTLGTLFIENTNTGRLMANIVNKLNGNTKKSRPTIDYVKMIIPDEKFVQRLADRETLNLAMMDLISTRSGATFFAVLLPTLFTVSDTGVGDEDFQARRNWINAVYDRMLSRAPTFPISDLRDPRFPIPTEDVFHNPTHYTTAGTRALAEIVLARLAPTIEAIHRKRQSNADTLAGREPGESPPPSSNYSR